MSKSPHNLTNTTKLRILSAPLKNCKKRVQKNDLWSNLVAFSGHLNSLYITFSHPSPPKSLKRRKKARRGGEVRISLNELPDELRIVLKKPFFEKLLLEGKREAGLWKQLARELKLDYKSLVNMRNGEIKSVSVATLKTLMSITGVPIQEVEKNCVYVMSVGSVRVKIPIYSSPQLASLVAHTLGDGSIGEKRFQVEYKNKSVDLIQNVVEAVKTIFNVEVPVTKCGRDIYTVMLPATIGRILYIAGAVRGDKTRKVFDVPEWIKNGDLSVKVSFLRALFDDEGSVYIGSKSSNIKLCMGKSASLSDSLINFFNSIRAMLGDFGIKSKEVRIYRKYSAKGEKKLILGFWITGKRNLKIFAQRVGFNSTRKQEKLETAIKSYKRKMWGEEVDDEILKILSIDGPKKTFELSKTLRKDRTAVLKHLHKLRTRGIVSFSEYRLVNGLHGYLWHLQKLGG